jgi:Protein of unknown function (DUF1353)
VGFRYLTRLGWLVLAVAVLALVTGYVAFGAQPWPFAPRSARVLMLMQHCVDPKTKKPVAGSVCPSHTPDGRQMWALSEDLTYRTHAGDTVTAPSGMPTDLASIPRAVQGLLPSDGLYAQAAIIHDACYRTKGQYGFLRKGMGLVLFRSRKTPYARAECDDLLDQAMADLGVGAPTRWTIWSAVRMGGANGWGR